MVGAVPGARAHAHSPRPPAPSRLPLCLPASIAAAPFGHNPELARRLGIEPKALQEPSRVEINGVPLPRAIPADDPQFQAIAERIAILDG